MGCITFHILFQESFDLAVLLINCRMAAKQSLKQQILMLLMYILYIAEKLYNCATNSTFVVLQAGDLKIMCNIKYFKSIYHRHRHARENCSPVSTSQSKLDRNVLKTILKISKVKGQIYMKRNPKFCNTK